MHMKRGGSRGTHPPHPPSVLIELDTREVRGEREISESSEITAHTGERGGSRPILDVFTPGSRREDRPPAGLDRDRRLDLEREVTLWT
jgi:hypothetical protein